MPPRRAAGTDVGEEVAFSGSGSEDGVPWGPSTLLGPAALISPKGAGCSVTDRLIAMTGWISCYLVLCLFEDALGFWRSARWGDRSNSYFVSFVVVFQSCILCLPGEQGEIRRVEPHPGRGFG